jgi:hypothetical protein
LRVRSGAHITARSFQHAGDVRFFSTQQVTRPSHFIKTRQGRKRLYMGLVIGFYGLLFRKRAKGRVALYAQVLQPTRGGIMLNAKAVCARARRREASFLFIHLVDRSLMRLYLFLQLVERCAQFFSLTCGLFMLFHKFVVARELPFGASYAHAHVFQTVAYKINRIAQTLRAVTILFDFQQAVKRSLTLVRWPQEVSRKGALRNAYGGIEQRLDVGACFQA